MGDKAGNEIADIRKNRDLSSSHYGRVKMSSKKTENIYAQEYKLCYYYYPFGGNW